MIRICCVKKLFFKKKGGIFRKAKINKKMIVVKFNERA